MKQSSVILAVATFALFPWLVDTYNLRALSLFDPSSSTVDLWESADEAISSMIRRQQGFFDHAFWFSDRNPSPGYKMIDNDETFQIDLQLPNIQPRDVDINLEGRLLTISGHGQSSEEGYSYSSSFSQSFTLDESVELDKISATMDSEKGVLTVAAPKDPAFVEKSKLRRIPISQQEFELPALNQGEPVVVSKPRMASPVASSTESKNEVDPFHVKEKVVRAHQQREYSQNDDELSEEEAKEELEREPGYKMGELRRRRWAAHAH